MPRVLAPACSNIQQHEVGAVTNDACKISGFAGIVDITIVANAQTFGVKNLTPIHGLAPAVFAGLPSPDAIFVGGIRQFSNARGMGHFLVSSAAPLDAFLLDEPELSATVSGFLRAAASARGVER